MKYVIITLSNGDYQWEDKLAEYYRCSAKYLNLLKPGTKAIFCKGIIKEERTNDISSSTVAQCFGVGVIGDNYIDENIRGRKYCCDILTYQPFDEQVPLNVDENYLENTTKSNKLNYLRNEVREIDKDRFDEILYLASVEFGPLIEIYDYRISHRKFGEVFDNFHDFIFDESKGEKFTGFSNGYLHKREYYKQEVKDESLSILGTDEWDSDLVGKGEILKRIIQTFELESNNLVGTRRKYGPDSVPHRKMIKAVEDGTNLVSIEQTIFNIFRSEKEPEALFTQMVNLIGKQYSVIAFIFYLKNDRQYLPISTTNFEKAFKILGCNIRLARNCSWANYKSYLGIIRQIKDALECSMNQQINLIDAHSFCWLLGYDGRYEKWMKRKDLHEKRSIYNAFEISPVNKTSNKRSLITISANRDGHIDWDKENKIQRIKGRRAEELVMDFERQRLLKAGQEGLAAKVEDYSTKYSKGFDVLSWNEDGTERNIEVKSSSSNGFIITRNELNKSENNLNYWIYIVNEKGNAVQIKQIKSPALRDESQFRLEPKDYYVSFSLDE